MMLVNRKLTQCVSLSQQDCIRVPILRQKPAGFHRDRKWLKLLEKWSYRILNAWKLIAKLKASIQPEDQKKIAW